MPSAVSGPMRLSRSAPPSYAAAPPPTPPARWLHPAYSIAHKPAPAMHGWVDGLEKLLRFFPEALSLPCSFPGAAPPPPCNKHPPPSPGKLWRPQESRRSPSQRIFCDPLPSPNTIPAPLAIRRPPRNFADRLQTPRLSDSHC